MGTTTKGSVPSHNKSMPLPKNVKDTVHKNGNPGGTLGALKGKTGTNYKVGDVTQSKGKGK
jgi:hypothetical protein